MSELKEKIKNAIQAIYNEGLCEQPINLDKDADWFLSLFPAMSRKDIEERQRILSEEQIRYAEMGRNSVLDRSGLDSLIKNRAIRIRELFLVLNGKKVEKE